MNTKTTLLLPESSLRAFCKDIKRDMPPFEPCGAEAPAFELLPNGRFYVRSDAEGAAVPAVRIEADETTLWAFDAWEAVLFANRDVLDGEAQSYFAAHGMGQLPENMHCCQPMRSERDIPCSDVYLLIPGRVKKEAHIPQAEHLIGARFNEQMANTVDSECKNEYIKRLERSCLGTVELFGLPIDDEDDEPRFLHAAIANLVIHRDTRLCVLELIVPHCTVGSNYLMNVFRADKLRIRYNGELLDEPDFAARAGMSCCGEKRSMVFAYGELTDEQIVGALANEYKPMGKIGGVYAEKVAHEDLAQYDTARVYVSRATMIECCPPTMRCFRERLAYQTIEIFFVELILLNDAAVESIYEELQTLEEDLLHGRAKDAPQRLEHINGNMSQALRFADFDQFRFPTVRESSRRVAEAFGIDAIFSRYADNKAILAGMVEAEQRRVEKRENAIKNRFLFFITALSMIKAVSEALDMLKIEALEGYSYFVAAVVVLVLYGLYRLIIWRGRKEKKHEAAQ